MRHTRRFEVLGESAEQHGASSENALDGAAAIDAKCCDARGLQVLTYTRGPGIYESYLAYAMLQTRGDGV